MDKRLKNKKAIITGGSRGIGEGIVKRLYDEGSEIIIADIRKELAENLINNLDKTRASNKERDNMLNQKIEMKILTVSINKSKIS